MKDLEAKQSIFVGKITAGVTHEINNVLAIIKETSGLMEDLLSLTQDSSFPFAEKFSSSISSIHEQINRGVELVKKLNQFAHSSDEPVAQVDLNTLLEQIIFLTKRFARKKSITMHIHPFEQTITVITNPMLLQMILFESMEYCWDEMSAESRMVFSVQKEGNEILVKISCEINVQSKEKLDRDIFSSPKWTGLEKIMGKMGGRINYDASNFAFTLILPEEIKHST